QADAAQQQEDDANHALVGTHRGSPLPRKSIRRRASRPAPPDRPPPRSVGPGLHRGGLRCRDLRAPDLVPPPSGSAPPARGRTGVSRRRPAKACRLVSGGALQLYSAMVSKGGGGRHWGNYQTFPALCPAPGGGQVLG